MEGLSLQWVGGLSKQYAKDLKLINTIYGYFID